MFEDQNPNSNQPGGIPGNLPTAGEPEDIFGGIDAPESPAAPSGAPAGAPTAGAAPSTPSALGVGALRPKEVENTAAPSATNIPLASPPQVGATAPVVNTPSPTPQAAPPQPAQQPYEITKPSIGRGIFTVLIIIVVVGILGGGGWWIYNNFIKANETIGGPAVDVTDTGLIEQGTSQEIPIAVPNQNGGGADLDAGDVVEDDQVLFGEPIDRDGDGIDDSTEETLGTDPNNWDSDGDDVSDGDEVLIWDTNPLNPDTDGDTYEDGMEIKSGYNPTGPGKIFEAPQGGSTSTESTSTQGI